MSDEQERPSGSETARRAGRGGLAVAGAKIYFIAIGLVQQIALPRLLGLDGYGALSRVLSLASIAYNPVTTTSIQGVSRAVAQAPPELVPGTVRRVLTLHALGGLLLGAVFYVLSPVIARVAGAGHVEAALRVLSGVLVVYGVYTALIGVVNGQHRFLTQASFDVTSATVRSVGLLLGAFVAVRLGFSGPLGAVSGSLFGAALVAGAAAFVIGFGRKGPSALSARQHLSFVAPVLFGQILLNLLFQADLTLLGRAASRAALAAGAPLSRADALVGAYRATQLFSFLPYQILIAITFVLFPLLAGAAKTGDSHAIRRYVQTGVRLALFIAGAMVSVTVGLAPRLLLLVFGAEASALGGKSLSLLALGFGGFALFGILTTVLNSLGRERESLSVTGVAVALVAGACSLRLRDAPLGEELLWRTAQATTLGLAVATLTAVWLVHRAAGAVVSKLTAARVVAALITAAGFARTVFPPGPLMTLVAAMMTPIVFGLVLVFTGEIGRQDVALVQSVFRRRR